MNDNTHFSESSLPEAAGSTGRLWLPEPLLRAFSSRHRTGVQRFTHRPWTVRWCRDSWAPHREKTCLLKWQLKVHQCNPAQHPVGAAVPITGQLTWMKLQCWTRAGALALLEGHRHLSRTIKAFPKPPKWSHSKATSCLRDQQSSSCRE